MKHILKTKDFIIELEPEIFESDLAYHENTILHIYLYSSDFSAKAYMDIDIKDFSRFADELTLLYTQLDETARLGEAYGEYNYIQFSGDNRGHIYIEGHLDNHSQNNLTQILKFENVIDQTYLESFSKELYNTYHMYLK